MDSERLVLSSFVPWIFLVALLMRVALILVQGVNAPPVAGLDDAHYDSIASDLAFRGLYNNRWFPPGYPLLIAGVYEIFGHVPAGIRLLQAAIGAATCVLTALLGQALFGNRIGQLAGLALALFPGSVFFSWRIMAETIFAFLVVLCVLLTNRYLRERSNTRGAILGFALGSLQLFKSNLIIFPPLLLIWLTLKFVRERKDERGSMLIVWLFFVFAASLGPAMNFLASGGQSAFLPANAGHTLWWSNNPLANGYFVPPDDSSEVREFIKQHGKDEILEGSKREEFDVRSSITDSVYRDLALTWIRENPLDYLKLCLKKMNNAFSPMPHSHSLSTSRVARLAYGLSYGMMVPFILIGLWRSKETWQACIPMYLVILSYCVMVLIYYGTPRFTLIVMPLLCVFAALGVARVIDLFDSQRANKGQQRSTEMSS